MRKIIFGGANTLDNYIARKDGSYDWIMWSDEVMELMNEYWSRFDTILMGRKTFDVANQSSPKKKTKSRKARNPYGGMRSIVFSRSLDPGDHEDVEIINEDAVGFVKKLKREKGKDICLMGGGELARPMLEAGLIDEIGVNVHPILLGSGVPLFHEMKKQIDLELIECRPFKNGCVSLLYKVKS